MRKAFTLVELIVVITILAILATIAFISLQGFAGSARDSTRINDLSTIAKALEIFKTSEGYYPAPTDPIDITYSGSVAWSQGLFEEETQRKASSITSVPKDPLTKNAYTYALTNSRQEYELGAIGEKQVSFIRPIFGEVYAAENYFSYVVGNYNKKIVKVIAGDTFYVLGVPTLITSEINSTTIQNVLFQQSYSIKGSKNIAGSYANNLPQSESLITGTSFIPGSIGGDEVLIYSGSTNSLSEVANRYNLGKQLIAYYAESNLEDSDLKGYTIADSVSVANSLITGNVAGLKSNSDSSLNICSGITKVDSNANGYSVLFNDGTLIAPNLGTNTTAHFEFGVKDISKTREAFAVLKNDGTVVTWGNTEFGADSSSVRSELTDVTQIVGTNDSFAALKSDGTVVDWGKTNSTSVDSELTDIVMLYKDGGNFYARKSTGEFVIWGNKSQTKPSNMAVFNAAVGTKEIVKLTTSTFSNTFLFQDGTIYSWGSGSDTSTISSELYNIIDVIPAWYSFAALRSDGRVFAWGNGTVGGDTTSVDAQLTNVKTIQQNGYSYLALKEDGTVLAWGRNDTGGVIPPAIVPELTNITGIYGNGWAFAVLRGDGRVFTWGGASQGGDSSALGNFTAQKVYQVNSNSLASIADDGSVSTWGGGTNYQNTQTVLSDVNMSDLYGYWNQSYYIGYSSTENKFYQWGNIGYEGSVESISNIMKCNEM